MAEAGGKIVMDKRTEYAVFVAVVFGTYWAGMRYWSTSPQPLPSPTGDVPHTSVPPEPAVAASSAAGTARVLTTEEIARRCERAIAIVSGRHATGTGFLVRPGALATNSHILAVERIEDLRVTFPAARLGSMTTELLFEDPQRDLALLAVSTNLAPLEIESVYRFRRGQDVTVIGNPGVGGNLVLENAVSRGVMSTEVVVEGQTFYQLNIAVNPGNSGGPTIDSSGKVIGVVTRKSTLMEATAFCIPSADLLSAIYRAKSRPGDKQSVLSLHRARYVAMCLAAIGELFSDALSKAVAGMDVALTKRRDPSQAISLVRQEITGARQELMAFITNDFDRELGHVLNDVRIADSVRDELSSLAKNCFAMTTAIDAPEGSADTYRARVSLLQEKHRWYMERLRADLATANPK